MRVLVAPDSFKGSLTSIQACDAIEQGIREVFPDAQVTKIPVADGGEGTVEAICSAASCIIVSEAVTGPLGNRVHADYAVLPDHTAYVEMAAASGLLLAEGRGNPLITTTYGTGELIRSALDHGCRKIIIGLGGSATNDGGLGMAQALGYSFKDAAGNELGFGGGELGSLAVIDASGRDRRIGECEFIAACDVKNPLCGESGASAVYGPQKGASPEMVRTLDDNLRHFARVIRETLGADIADEPGAGAAGGLGGGLMAFCGARMRGGIDIILDLMEFDSKLSGVDLVITGEGRMDYQTAFGKVPVGIATRAKRLHKPVIAFTGEIGAGAGELYNHGIDAIVSIVNKPMALSEAMGNAEQLLKDAAARTMRMVGMSMNMKERDVQAEEERSS